MIGRPIMNCPTGSRSGRRPSSRGFTLVEVLVAVLIFGLLASISYGALQSLVAVSARQDPRSADLAELQRAVAALDSDLRQLVSRAGREPDGSISPALAGQASSLVGRRAGRDNPGDLPRSQLQRFGWRMQAASSPETRLVRVAWAEAISASNVEPAARFGFTRIESIRFRYRDPLGVWHAQWPAGGAPDSLPSAIEYALASPTFGIVRRVIVL